MIAIHSPTSPFMQRLRMTLGLIVWAAAILAVFSSVYAIQSRLGRDAVPLTVNVPAGYALLPGDSVFLSTDRGLEWIGEVGTVQEHDAGSLVRLGVFAEFANRLNRSVRVRAWRTPLTAEGAVVSLLPTAIQRNAAELMTLAWQRHRLQLGELWRPVIEELVPAYLQVVTEEFRHAARSREADLTRLLQVHAEELLERWPRIQEQLSPIIQEHLAPVLGRLVADAIADAPKIEIALLTAKGDFVGAFQKMLDGFAAYLANMPDAQEAELMTAVRSTWEKASSDPRIGAELREFGEGFLRDDELRAVVEDIYRQAIANNPRVIEFVRVRVLESEDIRRRLYSSMEILAPAAQTVLDLCLFDENRQTRPEVAHLLRSISLGRKLSWVTLEIPDPAAPPIAAGEVLTLYEGDAN